MKPDQRSVKTPVSAPRAAEALRPSPDDEIEIKFLVDSQNPHMFTRLRDYFYQQNMVKLAREGYHLISRQLDTPDMALRARNAGLRLRGNCLDGQIKNIVTPDICLKLAKGVDESGTLHRHEFQARVGDFNKLSFERFFEKYPLAQYPNIKQALAGIGPADVREFFRVDCYRNRYVIELPPEKSGLDGRRVCAELITDNCAFVLDTDKGLKKPLIIEHDLEVECEILFRPCDFDNNPRAARYSSSPLNRDEVTHVMTIVGDHILTALDGQAHINQTSKGDRGFRALDDAMEALGDRFAPNLSRPKNKAIIPAFTLAAAGKPLLEIDLHRQLPRNMGYVFGQRGIARRPAVLQ